MFPIFADTNIRIIHHVLDKKHILTSHQRIESFARLGAYLGSKDAELQTRLQEAHFQNPWYTPDQVHFSVDAWSQLLEKEQLSHWIAPHLPVLEGSEDLQIGLILAGNIPLVGWHDILTCLMAGFRIQVKPASGDAGLTTHLLEALQAINPDFRSRISLVDRLQNYDAIIATGSNNSARYFEHYFSKVPHVIRKNRNGVAVLSGAESKDELQALGTDIFQYFGLGCRNVSKLYVPLDYEFTGFFQALEAFESLANHHKYRNNYDYYKSIYLVNGDPHLDNGFLLLKQDEALASPLGVVFFQHYDKREALHQELNARSEDIQCIVGRSDFHDIAPVVPFGTVQHPGLDDFADGVSIFEFLKAVKLGNCKGKFVA